LQWIKIGSPSCTDLAILALLPDPQVDAHLSHQDDGVQHCADLHRLLDQHLNGLLGQHLQARIKISITRKVSKDQSPTGLSEVVLFFLLIGLFLFFKQCRS
jgi:hypothetical protein